MTKVSALILDPVTGIHREVESGETLVDGNGDPLQASTSSPSIFNKNMAALLTSSDGEPAVGVGVASTPTEDGYVGVLINGLAVTVGDGVKTDDCYFSGNAGVDPRLIADIVAGDVLFWNGSVALFELATDDRVDFLYND